MGGLNFAWDLGVSFLGILNLQKNNDQILRSRSRGAVDEIPALVTPIYNYSDWIRNADQKNSEYRHFSHSDTKENEINIYLTGQ